MAVFERMLCTCISCGFFIEPSLDFVFACKMTCGGIRIVAQLVKQTDITQILLEISQPSLCD